MTNRTLEALMAGMEEEPLSPELITLVAQRFKALAEPARLLILQTLREGERTVSGMVEETELGQANVSKHLQLLHSLGFVKRRKEGLYVYYSLAGDDIFVMCDIMCGRIEADTDRRSAMLRDR